MPQGMVPSELLKNNFGWETILPIVQNHKLIEWEYVQSQILKHFSRDIHFLQIITQIWGYRLFEMMRNEGNYKIFSLLYKKVYLLVWLGTFNCL